MPADRPERANGALTARLVRALECRGHALTEAEHSAIEATITQVADVAPHTDVVRQLDRPTTSNLLVEGWACRYITLADGRRQILALHMAGDFVDLHSFPMKRMDHSVASLTRCRFALAPHDGLQRITEEHPRLTRLLWLLTLIDAAILRQWLLGAGKRSALENAAHLVCELHTRLKIAGLADGDTFRLPLTQTDFGDALGISPVHTNRVMQQLRRMGLIQIQGSVVEILDWEALRDLAEFETAYLGLERDQVP